MHVNGSMYESMHCFRIDAGSSSYPESVFLTADMMVLTSLAFISGIVIHLPILCTYRKGLVVECILFANELPTFIKYLLKVLTIMLLPNYTEYV